jgi:hypothetical protein
MNMRSSALALTAAGVVALAGCDSIRSRFASIGGSDDPPASNRPSQVSNLQDETQGGQQGDPTPTRGERDVDFPVVAESVTDSLFPSGDDSKFAAASVPVLAPASMSRDQATGFVDSYRTTPDGYFARLDLEEFDVVVNGTRAFAVAPESAGARTRDTSQIQYSETDTGVAVTFNRFGADYSIEFVCPGAGGEGGAACVTEAKAAEFVERLVPVGGGGR